jgi:hypothetical protein
MVEVPGQNKYNIIIIACAIVIYSKNEEGKAFVHALCGRHNSSEQKRPYSRVLYLVLFDTYSQSESVILYSKF